MPNEAEKYQPGPVFYEVFTGGLRAMGKSVRSWAEDVGYKHQNVRSVATGHTNGPKARRLRALMVQELGEDTFSMLYAKRMHQEAKHS